MHVLCIIFIFSHFKLKFEKFNWSHKFLAFSVSRGGLETVYGGRSRYLMVVGRHLDEWSVTANIIKFRSTAKKNISWPRLLDIHQLCWFLFYAGWFPWTWENCHLNLKTIFQLALPLSTIFGSLFSRSFNFTHKDSFLWGHKVFW